MCGIAGIIEYSAAQPTISTALLKRMSDSIAHRGPDDEGQWMSPNHRAGFAFRRLAIIDLSANGHQPMTTADGRFTIVFNGEVYNHRALRSELEAKGYHYRSQSDTETILYGFAEWGADVLQKMVGMWGLAIWDDHKQELFCARDRIGIKPLYYTLQGGRFLFASEIKAMLVHEQISTAMNMDELPNYLAYSMSGADTLLTDIHKLAPGHFLRLSSKGDLRIEEYWNPMQGTANGENAHSQVSNKQSSSLEVEQEIMRLLRQAVKDRMMSDVPFGVFLSGGIDSSTNVALMAELMNRPVDTFSVGFKELEKYNELQYARQIAKLFKTNHHEVQIDHADALEAMEQLVWHEDEPNGDPTCIPLHFVSKLVRQSGTIVVQGGEGSDEQFAGYGWMHREMRFYRSWWKNYQAMPAWMRSLTYSAAKPLFASQGQFLALDYLRRGSGSGISLYRGGGVDIVATLQERLFTEKFRRYFAQSDSLAGRIQSDLFARQPNADFLSQMAYFEFAHRLPELLLMRIDKITMAHGLEARVPFLDHRLVEYTMQLPEHVKVPRLAHEGGETKHLLKRAVADILPHDIIYRPKQGFVAPVNEWFRKPLKSYWEREVLSSRLVSDGIFERSTLESLMQRHASGKRNDGKSLYTLLNLALWYKRFIG
ncbi:MAG: asparagine synthase (glutamine-hydrolyzing) [Candidatus Kapaibacteriota bacterium]